MDAGSQRRVPMWRTAFNVGYVRASILVSQASPHEPSNCGATLSLRLSPCVPPACRSQRLTREELDGIAPEDARYDADFFVDVIFQDDADANAGTGDSAMSHSVASPSSASIWQHVDQRKAVEPAGDSEAALEAAAAVVKPANAQAIAEPASFTIEDHDDDLDLGHDDPAEQWLGKVEAFIDQPPDSQSPAHTEEHSSRDQQQTSSNTAAVDAALTAARAAANDSHAQQAARVAAMAPVAVDVVVGVHAKPEVQTQPATASINVQAAPPTAPGALAAETATQPSAEKAEDSFDDWLDDDQAEPVAGAPTTDAAPAGAASSGAAPAIAANPAAPRPESDDLDDFMASLDDM